jgi:hypothetical protein
MSKNKKKKPVDYTNLNEWRDQAFNPENKKLLMDLLTPTIKKAPKIISGTVDEVLTSLEQTQEGKKAKQDAFELIKSKLPEHKYNENRAENTYKAAISSIVSNNSVIVHQRQAWANLTSKFEKYTSLLSAANSEDNNKDNVLRNMLQVLGCNPYRVSTKNYATGEETYKAQAWFSSSAWTEAKYPIKGQESIQGSKSYINRISSILNKYVKEHIEDEYSNHKEESTYTKPELRIHANTGESWLDPISLISTRHDYHLTVKFNTSSGPIIETLLKNYKSQNEEEYKNLLTEAKQHGFDSMILGKFKQLLEPEINEIGFGNSVDNGSAKQNPIFGVDKLLRK